MLLPLQATTVASAASQIGDSNGESCKGYFDLPCYSSRAGSAFEGTGMSRFPIQRIRQEPPLDTFLAIFLLIAAVGIPVLFMVALRVQRNPRAFFPGMDRRPFLRPASIETATALAVATTFSQALALLQLRRQDVLSFQVFRKCETVFLGLTIPTFLHAFLHPMSPHVPRLGVFLKLTLLIPVPHFVEAAAGIWLGVLEDRILREADLARLDDLNQQQKALRRLDSATAGRGQQFLSALKTLGPTFLTRLRAREADGQLSPPPCPSAAAPASRPSPASAPAASIDPPTPLPWRDLPSPHSTPPPPRASSSSSSSSSPAPSILARWGSSPLLSPASPLDSPNPLLRSAAAQSPPPWPSSSSPSPHAATTTHTPPPPPPPSRAAAAFPPIQYQVPNKQQQQRQQGKTPTRRQDPPPQQQEHMDALDAVEWQLRGGGSVKLIRGVLGWVVAAGVGCLACDAVLVVLIEVAGNSLAAYYAWAAQAIVD
ncbi:hypothetical protein DFJ73DRAFT_775630 [Zopfochytrium polystomum]|nr:hypothetical protein DFJ73DRAFT_775630 [Zopfochytrium polystomum]